MSCNSIYCVCRNNYIREDLCDCDKYPEYWKQGVGNTESQSTE